MKNKKGYQRKTFSPYIFQTHVYMNIHVYRRKLGKLTKKKKKLVPTVHAIYIYVYKSQLAGQMGRWNKSIVRKKNGV